MGVRLTYLHLTLIYSKGQRQDYSNFSREYLANGDRENIAISDEEKVARGLSIGTFTCDPGTF